MSTLPWWRVSPVMSARPLVSTVSAATRAWLSTSRIASRMLSLMKSASLSGCPSVTDSEDMSLRKILASRRVAGLKCNSAASDPASHDEVVLEPVGHDELGGLAPLEHEALGLVQRDRRRVARPNVQRDLGYAHAPAPAVGLVQQGTPHPPPPVGLVDGDGQQRHMAHAFRTQPVQLEPAGQVP